jgi:hypothetical protein
VIDTQSVKTSSNVPVTSRGTDAAKKIIGRKRGILTDTLGLILAVTVTAAGLSENALGRATWSTAGFSSSKMSMPSQAPGEPSQLWLVLIRSRSRLSR